MKTNQRTRGLSDEEIIELFWQRNERAIEETDRKYRGFLFTVAHNIVKDESDCEECLDDTYLGAWNSIPPKRPSVLQTFLCKIMRNTALGRFRKNHAAKRIPSEMMVALEELNDCIPYAPSAEEEYQLSELARVLNGYLHGLNDRRMFIFVWRYYYSDTVVHIAQMLSLSENTVRRELTAMRSELKTRLEEEGLCYE